MLPIASTGAWVLYWQDDPKEIHDIDRALLALGIYGNGALLLIPKLTYLPKIPEKEVPS